MPDRSDSDPHGFKRRGLMFVLSSPSGAGKSTIAGKLMAAEPDLVRRMIEGEVPAMQAELEAHGRWPAPAGWLPDNERARSLIQTGRPPPDPRR